MNIITSIVIRKNSIIEAIMRQSRKKKLYLDFASSLPTSTAYKVSTYYSETYCLPYFIIKNRVSCKISHWKRFNWEFEFQLHIKTQIAQETTVRRRWIWSNTRLLFVWKILLAVRRRKKGFPYLATSRFFYQSIFFVTMSRVKLNVKMSRIILGVSMNNTKSYLKSY